MGGNGILRKLAFRDMRRARVLCTGRVAAVAVAAGAARPAREAWEVQAAGALPEVVVGGSRRSKST